MGPTATQLGLVALAAAGAAVTAMGNHGETRSFIIGPMYMPSVEVDATSCPTKPKGALAVFRDSLPPDQLAQLAASKDPRAAVALMIKQLGFKRGPDDDTLTRANFAERALAAGLPPGKGAISSYPRRHVAYDLCTNPADFPALAAGHQEYLGKIGYGMNLDGKVGRHDLIGVDGEKGVDNAWYQAVGCANIARSTGDPKVGDNVIVSRQAPTLVEVTGIDDALNDDTVEVNVYAAARTLDLDATGKTLAWASYKPVPDRTFIGHAKGRIQGGVLITEPFDVTLRMHESIIDSNRELKAARINATLRPDGTLDGGFYGYQTLTSLEDAYAQTSTIGVEMLSCPAEVLALRKHADGYPDPRTHRNTAISVALRFKAVPAFVVHEGAPVGKVASK